MEKLAFSLALRDQGCVYVFLCRSCICVYTQATCDGFEGHLTNCVKTGHKATSPAGSFFSHFLEESFCCSPGADLLKLTKEDLVQICGAADGIRLYNSLKSR